MFSNRDNFLNINYSKCILCQKNKNDGVNGVIVNPMKSRNRKPQESYELIIEILTKNNRRCTLPFYLSRLVNIDNAAFNLQQNKAIWHKACRSKYCKPLQTSIQENASASNINCQVENANTMPSEYKICLFCDESIIDTFHTLSKITTYDKIKKSAEDLQDNDLLQKLGTSMNDLKTRNYHLQCISGLYNRWRLNEKRISNSNTDVKLRKEAYLEISLYIERIILDDDKAIFCLEDLKGFFVTVMNRLGISTIDQVPLLSHLNTEILKNFPLLKKFKSKDGTFFAKESAISSAIAYKYKHSNNDEDFTLSNAATIARKGIHALQPRNDSNLIQQEKSISKELQKLMTMIVEGNTSGKKIKPNQAVLSVCQIIQHNTRKRSGSGMKKRHQTEYETPLTRYFFYIFSFTFTFEEKMYC